MKIKKLCSYCDATYEVLYKKRNSKFCSRSCAYQARVLPRENRQCINCGKCFTSISHSDRKFCSKDCSGRSYSEHYRHSEEVRCKMSNAKKNWVPWNKGLTAKGDGRIPSGEDHVAWGKTNQTKQSNPEWAAKIKASTIGKINLGDKNGMKQSDAKAKVSAARKEMFKNPQAREEISIKIKKAWADGKFDGVRVGKCKWYEHTKVSGEVIKVQGTWELAFVKWADSQGIVYIAHRGRIPYVLDGKQKSYYPDFYVQDWKCWVDVKNDYHYSLQKNKFEALKKSGVLIKVLLKQNLIDLGVKLETAVL